MILKDLPFLRGVLATSNQGVHSCRRAMITVKDTLRATVRVSFDGQVTKQFHGPNAGERFENEVKVLRFLEKRGCPFVPKLLKTDPENLTMVTTNCGSRVDHLDAERCKELFAQLEEFGVRHEDPDIRNVTYRQQDGRFCLIDFEFAAILDKPSEQQRSNRKAPPPKKSNGN